MNEERKFQNRGVPNVYYYLNHCSLVNLGGLSSILDGS